MAASHVSVATGGKSLHKFRFSTSATASGMSALLYHLEQIAERGRLGALGMHEKDGGSARAFSRRFIDDLEPLVLQVIERVLDFGHAQRNMCQPAASAVLFH